MLRDQTEHIEYFTGNVWQRITHTVRLSELLFLGTSTKTVLYVRSFTVRDLISGGGNIERRSSERLIVNIYTVSVSKLVLELWCLEHLFYKVRASTPENLENGISFSNQEEVGYFDQKKLENLNMAL